MQTKDNFGVTAETFNVAVKHSLAPEAIERALDKLGYDDLEDVPPQSYGPFLTEAFAGGDSPLDVAVGAFASLNGVAELDRFLIARGFNSVCDVPAGDRSRVAAELLIEDGKIAAKAKPRNQWERIARDAWNRFGSPLQDSKAKPQTWDEVHKRAYAKWNKPTRPAQHAGRDDGTVCE